MLLETTMTYGQRLSLAGQVTVIGLATVFSVLAILMAALYIFQYFAYTLPNKKKKAAEEANTATPAPTATSANNDELIAVLTAAIAAYESASGNQATPFRVVSYKRKNQKTSWNGNSGIDE